MAMSARVSLSPAMNALPAIALSRISSWAPSSLASAAKVAARSFSAFFES